MYDANTRLAGEVSDDVKPIFSASEPPAASGPRLVPSRPAFAATSAWPRAPSFGQSILQYAPSSNGAEDYRQLAREVLAARALAELRKAA